MSNSIWKTPDQKPDKNCPIVFRNDIGVIYCALDPKSAFLMRSDHKWAYLHEVVAQADKAERLLEIARKALKEIKKVCDGCRWCDSNLYDPTPNDGRRIAETTNNALKQIEHKELQ